MNNKIFSGTVRDNKRIFLIEYYTKLVSKKDPKRVCLALLKLQDKFILKIIFFIFLYQENVRLVKCIKR